MTVAERVHSYLRYHSGETAREIAVGIDASTSAVTTALRKLEAAGSVKKLGEAFGGSKTWGLAE